MKVKIMRGLPGSGKSTLAKALLSTNSGTIVSADDYFMTNGEYRWDGAKLQQAHDSCKTKFSAALKRGEYMTIVDNTNVVKRDYEWYVMEALRAGAEVEVITVSTTASAAELARRNGHGVPEATILKMQAKWEA